MSLVSPSGTLSGAETQTQQIVTETRRLFLRRLSWADLDFISELFGSLEVMRFSLTGPLARTQAAEIQARIIQSYATQPLAQWCVCQKSTGRLIGLCGFLSRPRSGEVEWELAYRFLPRYWGQGFATEAAIACREIAFRSAGVEHISALVEPDNLASIGVAKKAGLTLQGETQLDGLLVLGFVLTRPQPGMVDS